jgi:hypothetical protein
VGDRKSLIFSWGRSIRGLPAGNVAGGLSRHFPLVNSRHLPQVWGAMNREKLDAYEKASQINKELAR